MNFVRLDVPGIEPAWVPADLDLRLPQTALLDTAMLHFLIYIPWDDGYLALVPAEYRDFFAVALPHLHARTTDVHVATCLPFLAELIAEYDEPVDAHAAHIAFILHDSGWSQMTDGEVAASLGVSGLALSGEAVSPKLRHVELGSQIARRLIAEYAFEPPLTDDQKALIEEAILLHDRPADVARAGPTARVVCDVDHLWSFTHENFWQDTLRKGVSPPAYVDNLNADLDPYFVSDAGRRRARALLREREQEVAAWAELVGAHDST